MTYDFGLRLRELRLKKKLTQAQVAKRLNISKSIISGYENNTKTPSLEILTQLCVLYDVSSDYVLGLDNRKMMFIDGLTQQQLNILQVLVREFRAK